MRQFTGKPVSPGYARGNAFLLDRFAFPMIPHRVIDAAAVDAEQTRFQLAVERSVEELQELKARVLAELGHAQSAIFAAHLGLLRDQTFTDSVLSRMSTELVNVEHALHMEVNALCRMLTSVENAYIRERAQDIRDIGARVMKHLVEFGAGSCIELPPKSVIVTQELLPSETMDMDRKHVAAIVTEEGGENSHAAILARALAIPAVTGIVDATAQIAPGTELLVDGEQGIVTATPSTTAQRDFTNLKTHYDEDMSAAVAARGLQCETRDGTRVSLLANLNRPQEVDLVAAHHLDGVGLFRTEFLFLDAMAPPSMETHLDVYRQLVDGLQAGPLVIRTLDLGGDKIPPFLQADNEKVSKIAARGLRFSLIERALFETQLRAILTAAQGCDRIRVLLPMVLGKSDLEAAIETIRSVAREVGTSSVPSIGAMIETPSALFALHEILELAEFVSIGTNDLTQFMLAADRMDVGMTEDFSVLHPSVLRAIAEVVHAAGEAGREVCICGEAASYPRTACLFVGMGVRQLSMSPIRTARVRFLLRAMTRRHLEELADGALRSDTPAAVQKLLAGLTAEPVNDESPS